MLPNAVLQIGSGYLQPMCKTSGICQWSWGIELVCFRFTHTWWSKPNVSKCNQMLYFEDVLIIDRSYLLIICCQLFCGQLFHFLFYFFFHFQTFGQSHHSGTSSANRMFVCGKVLCCFAVLTVLCWLWCCLLLPLRGSRAVFFCHMYNSCSPPDLVNSCLFSLHAWSQQPHIHSPSLAWCSPASLFYWFEISFSRL